MNADFGLQIFLELELSRLEYAVYKNFIKFFDLSWPGAITVIATSSNDFELVVKNGDINGHKTKINCIIYDKRLIGPKVQLV